VLYINFITSKVEPILKNLSQCLVLPAEIKESKKGAAIAKTYVLAHEHAQFQLREKIKKIDLENYSEFNKEALQKGDLILVHWGQAIEKITSKEKKSLLHYTEKTISSLIFPRLANKAP